LLRLQRLPGAAACMPPKRQKCLACARSQEVSADRLYRFERRYGSFSRAIGLPQGVSEDQISARYDNGELEVHVKKPAVETPHQIQIGNGKAAIEGKATKT
jgi:HSP20 family molecular chaperone IbpA